MEERPTISGPELEAAVERVMKRLGAQIRSDGGSALPGLGATPPTTETPPATSAPMTSAVSSGAGAGIKIFIPA